MNERINTWQAIQSEWEKKLIPSHALTPFTRYPRWVEEVVEAEEAYGDLIKDDTSENRRALALEMADTLILGLSVIASLGYDAENLIHEKLTRNHIKYDIVTNEELRQAGLDWDEAIAEQKRRWVDK